jgi:uncharacterized protein YndB with AHSA1/START domain
MDNLNNNYIAKASIEINAPATKVWEALINPEMIKQYLFGTEAKSDWKVGSPITYTGVWEGKTYEDKGTILEFVPEKLLVSTYWSSMSGTPDAPENYQKVSYELSGDDKITTLTITQENAKDQNSADHSGENWKMVLSKLKEVAEK